MNSKDYQNLLLEREEKEVTEPAQTEQYKEYLKKKASNEKQAKRIKVFRKRFPKEYHERMIKHHKKKLMGLVEEIEEGKK